MSNINLGPKESPQDAAAREAEAKAKQDHEAALQQRETLKQTLAKAEAQVPGAQPLSLKGDMLDATAYAEAHPEKYVRYLNTANTDRMPRRIHKEGFVLVDEKEANKLGVQARVGNLQLSETRREVHDGRVAGQKAENERRLRAHKKSMEKAVEAVAKQLRDQHGISVDPRRILVDE